LIGEGPVLAARNRRDGARRLRADGARVSQREIEHFGRSSPARLLAIIADCVGSIG
jgi:hypothetical protein